MTIELVQSVEASIGNDVGVCTLSITGCKPGNTLVLVYATRGSNNTITLPTGWQVLGGSNIILDSSDIYQRLFFATKKVTATTETIHINQTVLKRIYAVCAEFKNVGKLEVLVPLATLGNSVSGATCTKPSATDVMLYGVTSAYYTSGRLQTASPNDLVKLQGNADAERLACWFDNGSAAMTHTFFAYTHSDATELAIECLKLSVAAPEPTQCTIIGNTVGVSNPRPDWDQHDKNKSNFIKNKPLPKPTEEDNGKFVRVLNGEYVLSSLRFAEEVSV